MPQATRERGYNKQQQATPMLKDHKKQQKLEQDRSQAKAKSSQAERYIRIEWSPSGL